MRLIITKENVGEWVAYHIVRRILDFNPSAERPFVLGLCSGFSVKNVYKRLIDFYNDGVFSFAHVQFFNTGDYYYSDLSSQGFNWKQELYNDFLVHIDASEENIFFLDPYSQNPEQDCIEYEKKIHEKGVHLWICSIGTDGHLGFNESQSSLRSVTRMKRIRYETKVINAKFFNDDPDLVPDLVFAVGLSTIMKADEVLVLCCGEEKSRALQICVESGVSHLHPASVLQMHPNTVFIADEDAILDLRCRTYRYHKMVEEKSVHPKLLVKGLYKKFYALTNARIFDGDKFVNGVIIINDNKISAVEKAVPLGNAISRIDMKKQIVCPGFIDLQVNGCGGVDINQDISIDTLKCMQHTNLVHGVTSFAPTLITTSDERMLKAIDLINNLKSPNFFNLIAWHFEGPYISKVKKGIHEEQYIRQPSQEMLEAIIRARIDRKIVTLAPEENTCEDITKLASAGVIVSIGHTNATYAQIQDKIPAGLSMATHLYNAMRPLDSREPGAVGAVLESSQIYAGIIVDGVHSNYASVDIAIRSLGTSLFLVSDASLPAGTNIKEFEFGGRKIFHQNGMCVAEDGTLAGVAILLDQCVRNLVNHANITYEEAFRMASLYPARSIRKDKEYGYIKKGYIADMTILDDNLFVQGVVSKGEYILFQ